MCALLRGLTTFSAWSLFALASLTSAQTPSTFYYQTYFNLDGDTATGCDAVVQDNSSTTQTFSGIEASAIVTVENGELVTVERYNCNDVSHVLELAPAAMQDTGHPTYPLGGPFVEYRIADVAITPQTTIGFAASAAKDFFTDKSDTILPVSSASLAPCSTHNHSNNDHPIPAIAPWLLFALAVAAGLMAARALKTPQARRLGVLALFVCFAAFSGAVWAAVTIVL
ncbi:MAG: hypothetical protein FWC42_11290, partial [Proteobacteria bacterium]|nr:hypothetical protein [Pseudomonadota bacterium]